MILSNEDALKRLSSPLNLINSMKNKKSNSMSLFGIGRLDNKKEVKKNEEVLVSFNPFSLKDDKREEVIHKVSSESIPSIQPRVSDLIDNHDNQIKLGLAHDSALDVLTQSVEMLRIKLDDIRPDRLPSVIAATSKVVESIRKERSESVKNGKDREVHYHFYTPSQKKISDYAVIDVQ